MRSRLTVRARLDAGRDLQKASGRKDFHLHQSGDLPAPLEGYDQVFHIVSHKHGSRSDINRAIRIGIPPWDLKFAKLA